MSIGPYTPCPGGKDKKIKFCCPELLGELQKMQRMLEGDQHTACLSHVERLERQHPNKACLLGVKTLLLRILERADEARAAAAVFLEQYPNSPVALAEAAISAAASEDDADGSSRATSLLMQAIAASRDGVDERVYEAMALVSHTLAIEGQVLPARAIASLQMRIRPDDRVPLNLVARLNSSPDVPLLIKGERGLRPCPDDVPWKAKFDEAMSLAVRARWLEAVEVLEELARQVDDAPVIWRNLATLRGWVADRHGCIQALKRFADLDAPLEEAAEGLALALMLSDDPLGDQFEVLRLTYSVEDADGVRAALSSLGRAATIQDDLAFLAGDDGPPPMAGFLFFDRVPPDPDGEITLETVPRDVCYGLLYGKETDREARLELLGVAAPEVDDVKSILAELGEALSPDCHREVTGHLSASQHGLARRWRLPKGVSQEEVRQLSDQYFEHELLQTWPQSPLGLLDGKAPLSVVDQPDYRVRLLAAVLVLESWLEQAASNRFDSNRLRSRLALPTLEPIDPQETPVDDLPPVRWSRVIADKLSDEALVRAFRRALAYNAGAAVRRLAQAVAERPSLAARDEQHLALEILARSADDSSQAIEYVNRGRRAAVRAGQSCANWDLLEMSLRLARQEREEVARLLNHLRSQHINEPGVAQALTDFFIRVGALRPDGTVAAATAAPGQERASLVLPETATAEPGRLWTPDSQKPASEKPPIWTPGMD